jgi:hypothetical protein
MEMRVGDEGRDQDMVHHQQNIVATSVEKLEIK